ncbi:hypothetical protein cyc_04547 [Cyclospora cayetanensis]|uniref:Uncharacterized protein n=1 Tax=Cyclospora cayetanensis TaxID=88456 RepID=A0A1D3CXQ1_9EIME|nr:hypothetical protein cyc_04547 [Cyclospora cayetanensis]
MDGCWLPQKELAYDISDGEGWEGTPVAGNLMKSPSDLLIKHTQNYTQTSGKEAMQSFHSTNQNCSPTSSTPPSQTGDAVNNRSRKYKLTNGLQEYCVLSPIVLLVLCYSAITS